MSTEQKKEGKKYITHLICHNIYFTYSVCAYFMQTYKGGKKLSSLSHFFDVEMETQCRSGGLGLSQQRKQIDNFKYEAS